MPIVNEGSSTNLTLSFKYANLTVLLYAEPITSFNNMKTDLLEILRERYPKGLPNQAPSSPPSPEESLIPHPSKAIDIVLGKRVTDDDENEEWEEFCQTAGSKDTPKSLGLKDGACLAFAYRDVYDETGFKVTRSTFYDEQSVADGEEPEDPEMSEGEMNA